VCQLRIVSKGEILGVVEVPDSGDGAENTILDLLRKNRGDANIVLVEAKEAGILNKLYSSCLRSRAKKEFGIQMGFRMTRRTTRII